VVCGEGPAVALYDLARDRQAEAEAVTGALDVHRLALRAARERREDRVELAGREAPAGVVDRDLRGVAGALDGGGDRTAARRVADRVGDQVGDRSGQHVDVPVDDDVAGALRRQLDAGAAPGRGAA